MTVYFLECDGFVKIGYTENSAASRAADMTTGNPHAINVLAEGHGDSSMEAELHRVFADQRVRGEWFMPNELLVRAIGFVRATGTTTGILRFLNHPSAEADSLYRREWLVRELERQKVNIDQLDRWSDVRRVAFGSNPPELEVDCVVQTHWPSMDAAVLASRNFRNVVGGVAARHVANLATGHQDHQTRLAYWVLAGLADAKRYNCRIEDAAKLEKLATDVCAWPISFHHAARDLTIEGAPYFMSGSTLSSREFLVAVGAIRNEVFAKYWVVVPQHVMPTWLATRYNPTVWNRPECVNVTADTEVASGTL